MTHRSLPLLATAALFLAFGCDGPTSGPIGPGPGDRDAGQTDDASITYTEDIRPLLVENCVGCHQDGGIAPFGLTTYAEVLEVADRVKTATADGTMPPFYADTSGDCQTFVNDRTLREDEIAMIGAWVDGGQAEGPEMPMPPTPELPSLDDADIVLEMSADYAIDGSVPDDYRCFVVETDLERDRFVTAYEVIPGNEQRVHHVIVYNPSSMGEADRARALDAAEEGDGYTCYGGPRVSAPPLAVWAPGTGATIFPEGTGVPMNPGVPQIIQIHYNNLVEGSPDSDRTRVSLRTVSRASPAYLVPLAHQGIELPPRMDSVEQTFRVDLGDVIPFPIELNIWGAYPHMHTLGRTLNTTIHRADGTDECLLDMPRWDFDWQMGYFFDEPVTIDTDDAASITCGYSTLSRDETVRWGEGTLDEMCLNFVYVTATLFDR